MTGDLVLRFAVGSDVGLHREGNEDAAFAGAHLLAVADGMGGHAAGEVASATAISAIQQLDEAGTDHDILGRLRSAVLAANQRLREMVAADRALEGMGTTITALLADGPRLGLAHVGDSRAYLFRDGVLSQLSHDHSYVQQLVDDGRLSEADAEHHPQRNLLTRSLDGRDAVEPDLVVHEARVGDRYLLCTDGLSGVVRADQLTEALALPTPEEAKDRLIELALGGGAPDNVTCIVADIVEADGASGATTGRVLAGAAGDTEPGPGPAPGAVPSAAALAAEDADRPRPPRRRRGLVIALGTLLVLAVGCGVGWAYVQSQYYVGADHDHVAIYRGVEGKVAGVSLSSVSSQAPVLLSDLPAFEQDKVRDGISATGLGDARSIVDRLTAEASPSPTPAPLPTTKPTPSTKPCASPLPKSTVAKPTVPGTPCPTLRASAKPTVATR